MNEYEDDRDIADIGPDEPLGSAPVKFNMPIPTPEQVAGEVARQIINLEGYASKAEIVKIARDRINGLVCDMITERATPIIEEILSKPLQPTDGFGNAIGEPTSLQGFIAARVSSWALETVNSTGVPTKPNSYGTSDAHPRINWALGQIVNGELKKQVDVEVKNIVAKLKASATESIAKQIATQVSALVLK